MIEPLELAARLFGEDPPWPTPLVWPHADRPAPVEPDPQVVAAAWWFMHHPTRPPDPKEPR